MKYKVGDRIIERSTMTNDSRTGAIAKIHIYDTAHRARLLKELEKKYPDSGIANSIIDGLEDYYMIVWDNGEVSSLGSPSCYRFTSLIIEYNDIMKSLL